MTTTLVTGAGRGLGLAVSEQLLAEGVTVYAVVHRMTEGFRILKKHYGEKLHGILCDLGNTEEVEHVSAILKGDGAELDFIYNIAAVMPKKEGVPLEDTDIDRCLDTININTLGPLRVIRASREFLHDPCVIVNVSSGSGSIARCKDPTGYGYNMSKTALNMATMMLSKDPAFSKARFLCFHPGHLKTDMGGKAADNDPGAITAGEAAMDLIRVSRTQYEEMVFVNRKGELLPW